MCQTLVMIELSKINGEKFWVNPELIREVEKTPDTVITFVSEVKRVVQETPEQIKEQIILYKRAINYKSID